MNLNLGILNSIFIEFFLLLEVLKNIELHYTGMDFTDSIEEPGQLVYGCDG